MIMQTQIPRDPNKQPVILQLVPQLRSGGVERGTIEIARAIVKAGGKSLVASAGGPMVGQVIHCGATHIELPLASKNPFVMWRNISRLVQLVKEYEVDIIHARSRAPAWSGFYAAQKTGCHFMTTFHGTYGIQNKYKRIYNSIMTRGELVIAISHFIADHIKKNYATDPKKLRVIHRGVDLKLFNPQNYSTQRMIDLTREWRLPEDVPLILCPGRITRWKGQDVFIRALAKLPHRNFFAVILGDDIGHETYRIELEKLISRVGLEGYIRIARHTSFITEAYVLSKLVVSTSIEPEAFGRIVLEAQAMGRPVIATNHGGPQETVIDKETGLLVPPGDSKALAAAIDNVLQLPEDLQKQIERDSAINARQFSLDKMCDLTISVYKELLGMEAPAQPNEEYIGELAQA